MLLTDAAFEFIEDLDKQTDTASLLNSFQNLISKYGFSGYCIGDPSNPHVYRKDRVWCVTWPEGWLKRFADQRYQLVDPLIRHMGTTSEPFRWSDVRPSAGPAALQVLDEATEFGMNDGFALPIYGTDGAMIGVTVAAQHYELDKRDEAALHMAAIYFHAKFSRFRMRNPPIPKVSKLTSRGRECLSWVASGKTDWEISQILNISEQTAHEYVQNAITKLNATTRAQAVAVAMLTRQILQ